MTPLGETKNVVIHRMRTMTDDFNLVILSVLIAVLLTITNMFLCICVKRLGTITMYLNDYYLRTIKQKLYERQYRLNYKQLANSILLKFLLIQKIKKD